MENNKGVRCLVAPYLSSDCSGSFELVSPLHKGSSHQAFEKPFPRSKQDFTAASPVTTLTV